MMILKLPLNLKKEEEHLFDYMLKNESSLSSVKEIKMHLCHMRVWF
jgi:hypothetical protein